MQKLRNQMKESAIVILLDAKDANMTLLKETLSRILYHIGDIISLTTMRLGDGYGWKTYNKIMLWSVGLDKNGKIWKYVKPKKKHLTK
jgi:hypothetical protein